MKNPLLLATLALLLIISCKKTNDSNNRLPHKAETKPQYDNTSFGVYKGVIIGSSGNIVFSINNGDNIIKGYLSIDGKRDTLTTSQTLKPGEKIQNMKFTGRFSSMTLHADEYGDNVSLTDIQIEGHSGNVVAILFHENSNQQITCYEGKLTGDRSGTIVLSWSEPFGVLDTTDGSLNIAVKFDLDTVYYGQTQMIEGEFYSSLDKHSGWWSTEAFIKGRYSKDKISGTWEFRKVYGKGNFTAKRTY